MRTEYNTPQETMNSRDNNIEDTSPIMLRTIEAFTSCCDAFQYSSGKTGGLSSFQLIGENFEFMRAS